MVTMNEKVKKLGNLYGFTGGSYAGNVYDKHGLCPTLNTVSGGNRQVMIIVKRKKGSNENSTH